MKNFVISAKESVCHTKEGFRAMCLRQDVKAFYHDDYMGGGNWRVPGTIENLICTLKNDITPYADQVLENAANNLVDILAEDLPEILKSSGKPSLRVCVIPRSKHESHYSPEQLLFRDVIRFTVEQLAGFEKGTKDIIRHTDTATTHLARRGNGGPGMMPYVGITKDTCNISDDVVGKDILLIDDLYTKTVNIDEDCLQALLDKGAKSVMFYSVGKTKMRY